MLQRIKDVRKSLNLTQSKFAEHLGLTQTAYSMIENGKRPLSNKYIKIICSEFGINENWLRNGLGEMFSASPYEKEFIYIFEQLTFDSQSYLLKMAKELLKMEDARKNK